MNRKHLDLPSLALLAGLATAAAACGQAETCPLDVPGTLCTIAGNGDNGYSGDGGDALAARLSLPQDMLVAPDGTIFILDWNNHRLRSLPGDGTIQHVAGRGELGGDLDDPANGDFNHPTNMIFGPDGDTLIIAAWHNSKIREIDIATKEIVDTCGDGRRAYFGDGGPALTASLDLPASVALDPENRLVIMDQANQVIRRIEPDHTITRIAGQCVIEPPGGCGDALPVDCPGPSDKTSCDPSLCSLPCSQGFAPGTDDALSLRMAQPFGQAADPAGRIVYDDEGGLLFADSVNHLIRRIAPDGTVATIAGTEPIDGDAQEGYAGDGGPATEALLYNPVDLALADDGTLYFTDVQNHCVRAIDPAGTIRTVVGVCGVRGDDGDGVPAEEALLTLPYGVEYDDGTLYVADTGNNVIRAVNLP